MKKVRNVIFLFFISFITTPFLFGQTNVYLSSGAGKDGGVVAFPYKNPFLGYSGSYNELELEKFFTNNNAISIILKHVKYDKSDLFGGNAKSKSNFIGISYNHKFGNKLNGGLFTELGTNLSYGQEKIDWQFQGSILSVFSPTESIPDSSSGFDKVDLISFGFKASIGYLWKRVIIKINIEPRSDIALKGKRLLRYNSGVGDGIYDFNYKSSPYLQIKFSLGYCLYK
jgi:hypothetical protein